jgi:TP901 family phage tail tape measure protein
MADAARDTKALGAQAEGVAAQTKKSAGMSADSMKTLGRGMLLGGTAVLAGFGVAVAASARFEKEMSGVKAVANATSGEMKQLSDAALKAGADTAFSATDAAQAEAELAKAGIAVKDILGGALTGSLSLAAAGQLDLAQAATISAQAMNIFKLQGKDVGHIADVLAAGANKSAADVGQLGDALRQGGLVASQTGLSLEETTGALAAFADSALVGSDAGTSLKTMLQRLTPQSAEAAELMSQLGITAYDASGQFVGLEKLAGSLRQGLSGLTAEQKSSTLATIFGSDAVRAAAILYDQGADGIKDYVQAVNDQGAAARMAATQMDNLSGDVEALKGSFETALIQSGSGGNKVMRELVQTATAGVNVFNDLPGPIKATASGIVVVGGAATVAGGAFLLASLQVKKLQVNLIAAGVSAQRTTTLLRGVGMAAKGIGAAAGILTIAGVIGQLNEAGAKAAPSIEHMTEAVADFLNTGRAAGTLAETTGVNFEDLGKKIKTAALGMHFWNGNFRFTGPGSRDIKEAREALDSLDKTLAGLVSSGHGDQAAALWKEMQTAASAQGVSVKDLESRFDDYQGTLASGRAEQKLAGKATSGLTSEIDKQAEAAKANADALRDQANALKGQFDPIFAVQDALSKQAEAQKAVNDALTKHGRKSAEYKQAQQDALRATVDLDGAVLTLEAGLKDGSVSLDTVNSRLDAYVRAGLISAAQARAFKGELALVAQQTDTTAHKLGLLNQQHPRPTVALNGFNPAMNSLRTMERTLNRLDGRRVQIDVDVATHQTSLRAAENELGIPRARGGIIRGRGSGTSDSILTPTSNGEYVVNAAATSRNRALLDVINSGGSLRAMSSVVSSSTTSVRQGDLVIQNPVAEKASESLPRAMSYMQFMLDRG